MDDDILTPPVLEMVKRLGMVEISDKAAISLEHLQDLQNLHGEEAVKNALYGTFKALTSKVS